MKKKIMLSLAAVAMVGTLAVGGTLAWFTDTTSGANQLSTGHVEIDLWEKWDDGSKWPLNSNAVVLDKYTPGQVVEQNVGVENIGNEEAFLKVTVEYHGIAEGMEDPTLTLANGWVEYPEGSNTYYYNKICKAKKEIPFYTAINLPSTWDNSMTERGALNGAILGDSSEDFWMEIKADAIQSDNTGIDPKNTANLAELFGGTTIQEYVPHKPSTPSNVN